MSTRFSWLPILRHLSNYHLTPSTGITRDNGVLLLVISISINKHVDALFFITHASTFTIALQALVLRDNRVLFLSVYIIINLNTSMAKSISEHYYRTLYASLHDMCRAISSKKKAIYLNIFFKPVKADGERIKALIRRFIQVLMCGGGGAIEFTAGGMYLLGEVGSFITHSLIPCWSNRLVIFGLRSMINHKTKEDTYDARKRDPQFAHASLSPLWELVSFLFSILSFPILNLCRTNTTPQSRSIPVNTCLPNHSQPPKIFLKTHFHFLTGLYAKTKKNLNKSKLEIQESGKVLARCNRLQATSTVCVGVKLNQRWSWGWVNG